MELWELLCYFAQRASTPHTRRFRPRLVHQWAYARRAPGARGQRAQVSGTWREQANRWPPWTYPSKQADRHTPSTVLNLKNSSSSLPPSLHRLAAVEQRPSYVLDLAVERAQPDPVQPARAARTRRGCTRAQTAPGPPARIRPPTLPNGRAKPTPRHPLPACGSVRTHQARTRTRKRRREPGWCGSASQPPAPCGLARAPVPFPLPLLLPQHPDFSPNSPPPRVPPPPP
jgi:hypothetical protein